MHDIAGDDMRDAAGGGGGAAWLYRDRRTPPQYIHTPPPCRTSNRRQHPCQAMAAWNASPTNPERVAEGTMIHTLRD